MLLGILAFLSAVKATLTDCATNPLFTLTSMSFSPDPPVKGQNSTLLLSMNVPADVTGGTATYSVTYNFIPLAPTTENLCNALPSGCPIVKGTLDTVSSIPFDGSLSGSLVMKIDWKDLVGQELMCVQIKTKV